MAKDRTSLFTQNITYFLVCLMSTIMVFGSFVLRYHWGSEAKSDETTIEYSYQNESSDPLARNHFRRIKIKIENVVSLTKVDTKDMRVAIYREGELGDKNLQTGKVFSLILEDMAKFKSVIFEHARCVTEHKDSTDITVFLFKKYDSQLAVKVLIIHIDRQTDKISVMGKELSTADIWDNRLADPSLLHKSQVPLDKGVLRLLSEANNGNKE